jgi:biotin-(acetyl-CoA carboxylase) ligase
MADTAEDVAGLRTGAVRLKWPNDLVIEAGAPEDDGANAPFGAVASGPGDAAAEPVTGPGGVPIRKLGGVLGEADGLGTDDPRVVVGIGLNAGWARADFPAEIAPAMTSLAEASGGRPIERALLLDGFLSRLEARVEALRAGRFPMDDWTTRQVTTGRFVRLEGHGSEPEEVRALGLDPATGALLVADPTVPGGERAVHAGDVVHVRLASAAGADRAAANRAASRASAAGV